MYANILRCCNYQNLSYISNILCKEKHCTPESQFYYAADKHRCPSKTNLEKKNAYKIYYT